MGGALPWLAARVRRTRIVIFAKAPVAGKVKTRLIPALGEEGAARLAREMLEQTASEAAATGLGVELCATPAPAHSEWKPFLPDISATDQGEGDLGERLARAAARVIGAGENVLLIGADCPELGRERLRTAAEALERSDAVLYPVEDGGYALLGLRRFDPSIFSGIAWSTASVAAETTARIKALGWSLHIGKTLRDVDEPEDLPHLPSC
jgi:rSAM/selenodomain-associated transferase 1